MDYNLQKIQPQAIEIEESILGAMMTFPNTLDIGMLNLFEAMFYKTSHQVIFSAIKMLYNAGKGVDILTVVEQLRFQAQLEDVGGPYQISRITDNNIGPFTTWCAIIKQKYIRREAIRLGYLLQQVGFDDTVDELEGFNTLDEAHKALSDILFSNSTNTSFADVAAKSIEELRERIILSHTHDIIGINTGLSDLNIATCGWNNGDLIIIAGRPGMGKTAIALHFAKTSATRNKHTLVFSLEMTNTRLVDRIIVGETQVNNYKYKLGRINDTEFQAIKTWVTNNQSLPIHLDEKSFVTIDYIISNARMRKRKNQLDLLIIDYLQLIEMNIERNATKDQMIGIITRKLKSLAKELNIPIILLSQLSRAVENRSDKRPQLSDLRESGNIEQDADIVIFTYRPAYYKLTEYNGKNTSNMMILDIAKHRNGQASVDIFITHNESLSMFDNYNDNSEYNVPY